MKAIIIAAIMLAASSNAMATRIVPGGLNASLYTGSLAGTRFPVSFSYDADQVSPIGDSFVGLNSFNFTLLNVSFTENNILQGGQVIFRNGLLDNVTASFQGPSLPPQSPVENITFGFGGPGVIGYIDLNGQFALGSFTFVSTAVSEPISGYSLGLGLVTLFGLRVRWKINRFLRGKARLFRLADNLFRFCARKSHRSRGIGIALLPARSVVLLHDGCAMG